MSRKQIFYLLFFTVLVLCFFFALSKVIPGFFQARMPPISTVQPFAFVNQQGQTVTEKDLAGKVHAANFFFTTCKGVCPRMNNNLKPVYEKYKKEENFLLLSYTCDPSTDSVPVIRHYADSIGADPKRWIFLTGNKDSLYAMARHSYLIDDPKNATNDETDFLHTQFIALVNRKGEVVKIYDGIKPSEVRELEKDIESLLKE